jgi:hypothetical protein
VSLSFAAIECYTNFGHEKELDQQNKGSVGKPIPWVNKPPNLHNHWILHIINVESPSFSSTCSPAIGILGWSRGLFSVRALTDSDGRKGGSVGKH